MLRTVLLILLILLLLGVLPGWHGMGYYPAGGLGVVLLVVLVLIVAERI